MRALDEFESMLYNTFVMLRCLGPYLSGSLSTSYIFCNCWNFSFASTEGFRSGCTVRASFLYAFLISAYTAAAEGPCAVCFVHSTQCGVLRSTACDLWPTRTQSTRLFAQTDSQAFATTGGPRSLAPDLQSSERPGPAEVQQQVAHVSCCAEDAASTAAAPKYRASRQIATSGSTKECAL